VSEAVSRYYHGEVDWLAQATILMVRHGSQAYGTSTPESDLDVKGVAVPPQRYFTGFLNRFEQAEQKATEDPEGIDLTIFDIRKFCQLAADCNPNIIEVLWVDPEDILYLDAWGQLLLQHRADFLSQKAKHTFSGYAVAQLKRIKTHREWLLNPPKAKPERREFNLPETTLVSRDQMGVIEKLESKGTCDLAAQFGSTVMDAYRRERSYHNALTRWNQYQNWKKTRNPARAALEEKFGYDCKHGMHLVRLMRMCREVLTSGVVHVRRADAEELLAIRNGAWTYDHLVEWAEQQDASMDELLKTSPLPHSPDRVALDKLCRSIVESHFSIRDDSSR
jgi:predicted nucleotidyltransferase